MDAINATDDSDILTSLEYNGAEKNSSLMTVLKIFVCVVGVIGNMMVIFVILVLQEYKKAVTHWYVLQLAFADCLFLLTLPFKVAEDEYGQWIFPGGMCKAKEAIVFLNYYSSILFLMLMSIDRYIAVCHGFSQRLQKFRTKRSAYIITVVVWVVSLLFCVPVILYSNKSGIDPQCKCKYEFPKHSTIAEEDRKNRELLESFDQSLTQNEDKCQHLDFLFDDLFGEDFDFGSAILETTSENRTNISSNHAESGTIYQGGCTYARQGAGWTAHLYFNFIVMFVMPFLIMSVCYCLIAIRLKQSRIRRSSVTNESTVVVSTATRTSGKPERKRKKSAASAKVDQNRIRVTVTCLILVVLFLLCWLPFHTVHLAKMYGIPEKSSEFCANLSAISSVIAYLNSALNPYIYNFIGTKFGKKMRRAARSVRTSVKERTSSLSSAGGKVRYQPRKYSAAGTSSNSATAVTKIYGRKSEMETSSHPYCEDETAGGENLLRT